MQKELSAATSVTDPSVEGKPIPVRRKDTAVLSVAVNTNTWTKCAQAVLLPGDLLNVEVMCQYDNRTYLQLSSMNVVTERRRQGSIILGDIKPIRETVDLWKWHLISATYSSNEAGDSLLPNCLRVATLDGLRRVTAS
jgi:hypothetical protein